MKTKEGDMGEKQHTGLKSQRIDGLPRDSPALKSVAEKHAR